MALLHHLQAPVHHHCHLLLRPLLLCCLQAGKAERKRKAAESNRRQKDQASTQKVCWNQSMVAIVRCAGKG
jgi:hypothetical protein